MDDLNLKQSEMIEKLDEQNVLLKEEINVLKDRFKSDEEYQKKKISEDSSRLEKEQEDILKEKKDNKIFLEKQHDETLKKLSEVVTNLEDDNQNSDTLVELKNLNKNLDILVSKQEENQSFASRQLDVGTITLSLLIVGVGAYASIKIGMWVVSKLNRIMFY